MMNGKPDYLKLSEWLQGCERPVLFSHRRPDGDALGALGGMARALAVLGKSPRVMLYEPISSRYAVMAGAAKWELWEQCAADVGRNCDAAIVLDTCAWSQLEPVADFLRGAPRTLVLDHHATHDELGERAGDLKIIDATASAASLLVAEWVQHAGIAIDEVMATALFVGISTDCGWFRFANTDARTLRVAAELVAAGVTPDRVYTSIYQQDSAAKVRLVARLLTSLEVRADGALAVMYLRKSDFAAAGASRADTEDLVNEAGRLAGTEATVMFTEEDGEVRLNFRSRLWLDVAKIAEQFGGGGHARAAGARVQGEWDAVTARVIGVMETALAEGEGR